MDQEIIVASSLATHIPEFSDWITGYGATPVYVSSWPELAKSIHHPECLAIILSLDDPILNGKECARQIRARAAFATRKIVLVGEGSTETIPCDMIVPMSDKDKIHAFLDHLLTPVKPSPRAAARFDLIGELFYVEDGQANVAEILNASRTGVLLATEAKVEKNKEITLRFQSAQGHECDIQAIVLRQLDLPRPRGNYKYGIGAQFVSVEGESAQKLDWLLAYRTKHSAQWSPDSAEKILEAVDESILDLFRDETRQALVQVLVSDFSEFDSKMLNSKEPYSQISRKALVVRCRLSAITALVPMMERTAREKIDPLLVPSVGTGLAAAEATELELEALIQSYRESGPPDVYENLVTLSNRLHETKIKMLFSVDESLSHDGISSTSREVLQSVRQRVNQLRRLQRT